MGAWRVRIDPDHSHGPRLPDFLAGRPLPASLALSRASSASNRGRLAATLAWLGPRASAVAVVDGSFLARWNAMAFDRGTAGAARDAARKEAAEVRRRILRAVESAGLAGKAAILEWEDLAGSAGAVRAAGEIDRFSRAVRGFDGALRAEADAYVRRTRGTPLASLPPETAALLRRYVVEEVAVLLDLQRRGFPVEVYHGPELPLLRAIGDGRFPGFPLPAPERTHVAISLVAEQDTGGRPPDGVGPRIFPDSGLLS
jgi:tRNA-dependent cyclodipeptide synthase